MNLNEATATLIAAIIAAVFSLINIFTTKPTEIRTANRKSLEPYIHDLSDSIHQLIAISNILLKNKTVESRNNWRIKAEHAKSSLKDLRPKIRYSLWGLENYILSLTRLPDFTLYTLENEKISKQVVKSGTKFGDYLDNCVRKCYINGRIPYFYEIWILNFYDWQFRKLRNDYKSKRKQNIIS